MQILFSSASLAQGREDLLDGWDHCLSLLLTLLSHPDWGPTLQLWCIGTTPNQLSCPARALCFTHFSLFQQIGNSMVPHMNWEWLSPGCSSVFNPGSLELTNLGQCLHMYLPRNNTDHPWGPRMWQTYWSLSSRPSDIWQTSVLDHAYMKNSELVIPQNSLFTWRTLPSPEHDLDLFHNPDSFGSQINTCCLQLWPFIFSLTLKRHIYFWLRK